MAQPTYIGASIDMDLGTGTPERIPSRDLGEEITLSGSLEGFGVREMSFERHGWEQSLWRSRMIQNMASVELTGYRGTAGDMTSYSLFEGWTRDAEFDADLGITRYTCQDVSLPFVDAQLFLTLEAGSGQTRKDVVEGLFTDLGWPQGTHDWPNTNGGYAYKAISEGGDRRVSEWLVDFLAPIGRRARWVNGAIQIERFDTSEAATRTLTPADIRSISMSPPPTNAPNRVSMAGNVYPYTGVFGRRVIGPTTVSTTGDYTPEVAINVQDHTTGVISATGLTPTLQTGVELTRTVTTEIWEGGALIQKTVEEWGWCAPVACNQKQDSAGNISYNDDFDVYEFSTSRSGLRGNIQTDSGYWRTQPEETFQKIRTTVTDYYFDNASRVKLGERDTITELALIEMPCGYTTDHSVSWTGPTTFLPAYLCDDDRAHIDGKEQMTTHTVARGWATPLARNDPYTYDADTLEVSGWSYRWHNSSADPWRIPALLNYANVAHRESTATRQRPVYTSLAWSTASDYAYHDVPLYFFRRAGGTYGGYEVGRVYNMGEANGWSCYDDGDYVLTDIDGSSYTEAYTSSGSGVTYSGAAVASGITCIETNGFPVRLATDSNVISDPLPIIDTWTEGQSPTPTSVTKVDEVRTALADSVEIPEYRQNDYCENAEQLHLAAFDALREYAPIIQIETDWYMDVTEGSIIAVKDARLGASTAVKLLVESFSASLNLRNGDNGMSLSCRWYPPELDTDATPSLTAEVLS